MCGKGESRELTFSVVCIFICYHMVSDVFFSLFLVLVLLFLFSCVFF